MSDYYADPAECMAHGGHCYEDTGYGVTTLETSWQQECRHCPATRWKTARDPWDYTYPEMAQPVPKGGRA